MPWLNLMQELFLGLDLFYIDRDLNYLLFCKHQFLHQFSQNDKG